MCGSCGGSGGSRGMSSSPSCNPCMCPPPCYPRCSPCCRSSGPGGKIPRVCPPPCCGCQPLTFNAIICADPYECSPNPMRIPLHICGFASKPGNGCGGCC